MVRLQHVLAISLLLAASAAAQTSRAIHEGKPASSNAVYVDTTAVRVGVGTSSPGTTIDVQGSAQFGSNVLKSTFNATPGATTYAVNLASGVKLANGCVSYADGTLQCTASSGGGGGGASVALTTATLHWGNPYSQMTTGTTQFAFAPIGPITLKKQCVTITTAGNDSASHWTCNSSTGGVALHTRTTGALGAGNTVCSTMSVNIPATGSGGTSPTLMCHLESDAGSKPETNIVIEYTMP